MRLTTFALALLAPLATACMGSLETGTPNPGDGDGDGDGDSPDADPGPVDDGRVTAGLVGLWKFDAGAGTVVSDTSGLLPPLDFTIPDPVAATWLPTGGLSITAPTVLSAGVPTRIQDACLLSNKLSIEAWVKTTNLAPEQTARIVSYALDPGAANFGLVQPTAQASYAARLRTTVTGNNGEPATASALDSMNGLLQHVVYTRDAAAAVIWIDGVQTGTLEVGGNFGNWDPTYELTIANVPTLDRPWLGEVHLVAVYCDRLSSTQVQQNYAAGL